MTTYLIRTHDLPYINVVVGNANACLSGHRGEMARKKNKNQINMFTTNESITKKKTHIAKKKVSKPTLSNTCLGCKHQWKCTWHTTLIHTLHCPAYQYIHSYKKQPTNWSIIVMDINNLNSLSLSDKRKIHYNEADI